MISCLMVTQTSHAATVPWAIYDFVRQSFADKELIILHDSDAEYHSYLLSIVNQYQGANIKLVQTKNASLGELRNQTLELAQGDYICQWDDDDRYHSLRLEIQFQHLNDNDAQFCFFTDQLHLFVGSRTVFWDDWNIETYPMNLIQGSIMGLKELMPAYQAIDKGEDTPVVQEIERQKYRIAELSGAGYLYLYQYTGKNTWDAIHHSKISSLKHKNLAELEQHKEILQAAFLDFNEDSFSFSLNDITMPTRDGTFHLFEG